MGEPSKDKNGRDDNKRTRTGNVFATTANPLGRENTCTWPKCTTYNSYHAPEGPCRTCFNCNHPGYLAKDCRGVPKNVNPVNARNPTVRACYEYGSTDHVRTACPRLNRAQGCYKLWDYIRLLIDRWEGECVIMGDFNEVRSEHERFGSVFNVQGTNAFNNFISLANLIDLPLDGYAFTWAHKTTCKMSKLDRFLISKGLVSMFPSLSDLCLDRHLSDHRLILMHSNGIIKFKRKLQALKYAIKQWSRNANSRSFKAKTTIQAKLSDIDKILYQGGSSEDILNTRATLLKELNNINTVDSLEKAQKAKIRWAIEGDENSKYFHNILNKKRSQLAIHGILAEGDWIVDPHLDVLERNVTLNEIKSAVWECGTNKSPGLDGFTFEFFRRYWKFLEQDIMVVVTEFFSSGVFPSGCNSSFIAFISNIQDAKVISGRLKFAMGSVLVNGNPTTEFQFHKGFKQCEPLSPFLFILVMESLHLSFRKVMDAGLFSGISINNSLTISNLLYASDVVFVGKWDMSNIGTIVNVLKCFYLASGLKLNIHKSKIIRVGIRAEEVDLAAREVGCSTFSPLFTHPGVKVGGVMSRIKSWDEVLCKVSSRLSKWKLKTLSIGGCLTLIKSVLSSIPLYHISIFKVPMRALHSMESIRRNFFNDIDGLERKLALISWKKVLASKKYGGLGVSSIDLLAFVRKKVGNGKKSLFGDDIWLDDMALKHRYPRLYALELSKYISVSEKLSSDSLVFSFRRIPKGGIEEEQQRFLQARIEGIILAPMLDRWIWSYESLGEFSVKSTRSFIDDSLLPKEDVPTRWVNVIPI
ncbi:RNA-directed DNA polymerase, eukaryota [Tanacetum coccineum]